MYSYGTSAGIALSSYETGLRIFMEQAQLWHGTVMTQGSIQIMAEVRFFVISLDSLKPSVY